VKITEVSDGVFNIETVTQYDLTSTFMRVQEFYESPFKEIRGHFFTHEQYMDIHAHSSARSGTEEIKFSYLEDWAGFNVPGNAFNRWVKLFSKHELWDKERELITLVQDKLKKRTNKFYIIGTYSEGEARVIDHELSHAWFYLDSKYKRTMLKLIRSLPKAATNQLKQYLQKDGYDLIVAEDEIIAYLSTNPMTRTAKMFDEIDVPWGKILDLQTKFDEYKQEKIDEAD